ATTVQVLDGEFVGALLVGTFVGIGAGQWHDEAESDGVTRWVIAELLGVGAPREDERRYTGGDDAGEPTLQQTAAAEAVQFGHLVLLKRGGPVHCRLPHPRLRHDEAAVKAPQY